MRERTDMPEDELDSPKTFRQSFNNVVRTWGNKTKHLHSYNWDIGDFLTSNVNFRKVGAITGTIVPPVVHAYWQSYNMASGAIIPAIIMTPLHFALNFWPLGFLEGAVGGTVGYVVGEKIDWMLGDRSQRGGLYGILSEHDRAQRRKIGAEKRAKSFFRI